MMLRCKDRKAFAVDAGLSWEIQTLEVTQKKKKLE